MKTLSSIIITFICDF